jgi:hypothetical protein
MTRRNNQAQSDHDDRQEETLNTSTRSRKSKTRKHKTERSGEVEVDDTVGKFDRAMSSFLGHLKKVMEARESTRLIKIDGGPNPVTKYLNKYSQVYDKTSHTDPLEHLDYFRPLARRYLDKIASGSDTWLLEGSIIIQYGAGTAAESRAKEVKIMVSAIYQVACKLRDDKELQLEGKADEEYAKAHELNYPDILLLDLYRILCLAAPDQDKPKIRSQIERLETDLCIPQDGTTAMGNASASTSNGGFGNLFGMMGQIAGKMGIPIPQGAFPKENEISGMIENFINNDGAKTALTQMFDEVKDAKNPSDMVKGLMKSIGDPQLIEAIAGSATETMAQAETSLSRNPFKPTNGPFAPGNGIFVDRPEQPVGPIGPVGRVGPVDMDVADSSNGMDASYLSFGSTTAPQESYKVVDYIDDEEVDVPDEYCDEAVCLSEHQESLQ